MEELKIIYQDEHIVAINKPTGLLVHRSLIDKRETRFAIQILSAGLDETFVRVLESMEMRFDTRYLQASYLLDCE